MNSRGPVLTLVSIVSLALVLVGITVHAGRAQGAAAVAAAASPAPEPAPPRVAAPAEAEPPAPSSPPAAAFPAEAAYAGRTSGNEATLAVAVKDGRAVAYLCDGRKIEAWLEGTVDGTTLTLTGRGGASVTGELSGAGLFGQVTAKGGQWPYAASPATAPAGAYRGEVSVRGVRKRIGWNVLPDGTVTGLVDDGAAAPALDLTSGTANLDGAPVTVAPITGADVPLPRS
jgi:hypothetical protein